MSQTYPDTNYGTRKPEAIMKLPDQVVINSNIREVPYTDAMTGETVMTYIADAEMFTYQEYSTVQDRIIAQQVAINEEHDELFAMIIEGVI